MIVQYLTPDNVARQIANVHTIFNITSTLMLLPFNKIIIKLATKLAPDNNTEDDDVKVVKYITVANKLIKDDKNISKKILSIRLKIANLKDSKYGNSKISV